MRMATLITLRGPNSGQSFLLAADASIIGRQSDCTVCLESPAVSRRHAQITCEGGLYYIEDLGSSNHTFLNGDPVEKRVRLGEEDTIQLGPYFLALRLDREPVVRGT